MNHPLHRAHVLSADQFSPELIDDLFKTTRKIQTDLWYSSGEWLSYLAGKTLACVFYEPSTRTSASFIAAMGKLGGHTIPITQGVQFSSVAKGETLEDTIVTLGQYADVIVLRHPETGSARRAADVSPVPIINAGDGVGEHPTQALLDLYTILQEKKTTSHLRVVLCGDLLHGRTIHSLAHLLALYPGNHLRFVSPPHLRLPDSITADLRARKISFSEGDNLEAELPDADVLYMTRVQKERWGGLALGSTMAPYILTPEMLAVLKSNAAILHPLPRVEEIPPAVDQDPRAAYFRQVRNGLYVRAALLARVLEG